MATNILTLDQVLEVLSTDKEEVVDNEYGHDSDFESDISSSSAASSEGTANSGEAYDQVLPVRGRGRSRGRRGCSVWGRGRARVRGGGGRGRRCHTRASTYAPVGWTSNATSFVDFHFTPHDQPRAKNLLNLFGQETTPLPYLELMWTEELCELILNETINEASRMIAGQSTNSCAKSLTQKPLSKEELKPFFGLRISMEMLFYKDRYEQLAQEGQFYQYYTWL